MDEFQSAAENGHLSRVQALLPGVHDEAQRVEALSRAIRKKRTDMVKFLLNAGVPPEHETCRALSWGYPLHVAARTNNLDLVRLLLKAGANLNVFNIEDKTPLWEARSVSIVRALLDAGANPNAGAYTLLHVAASQRRMDLLHVLLNHPGIDLNKKNDAFLWTPLHCAASNSNPDGVDSTVEALLAAGADPCAVDGAGYTPLCRMHAMGIFNREYDYYKPLSVRCRIATRLVAAGDRSWACLPTPCPGLEKALVSVWKTAPEDLPELVRRLEPLAVAKIQDTLRALHHGARPFKGLPEEVCMQILGMALE